MIEAPFVVIACSGRLSPAVLLACSKSAAGAGCKELHCAADVSQGLYGVRAYRLLVAAELWQGCVACGRACGPGRAHTFGQQSGNLPRDQVCTREAVQTGSILLRLLLDGGEAAYAGACDFLTISGRMECMAVHGVHAVEYRV